MTYMQAPGPGTAVPVYEGRLTASNMTLRDWFAGQALAAVLQDPGVTPKRAGATAETVAAQVATVAYFIADAMLKAREAKP